MQKMFETTNEIKTRFNSADKFFFLYVSHTRERKIHNKKRGSQ